MEPVLRELLNRVDSVRCVVGAAMVNLEDGKPVLGWKALRVADELLTSLVSDLRKRPDV